MPRKKKETRSLIQPNDKTKQNPFVDFLAGLSPKEETPEDGKVWKHNPPSFRVFVTSPEYLGLPPLSVRQMRVLEEGFAFDGIHFFTGTDEVRSGYKQLLNEIILCWGKGGGKDYIASTVISYIAYVTLCLANPQKYLGLAPGENIDIVNVATREQQASDVFFSKLKARINSPCFTKFDPKFTRNKISFSSVNINLHSLHSRAQKWEGYNILAYVMDEADAFQTTEGNQNAEEIHGVLQSSAISRFPHLRWLGLIISYPRSEVGFMIEYLRKAEQAREDGHPFAYVDVAATWEVHPHYDSTHPLYKEFDWVTVHGKYYVPAPFEAPFRDNPQEAAMTYMCQPPPVEGAFFEFPDLLDKCVNHDLQPVLIFTETTTVREVNTVPNGTTLDLLRQLKGSDFNPIEERRFTALRPLRWTRDGEAYTYYIHGDAGETKDSFAVCLAHSLPEIETVSVVDRDVSRDVELNRVVVDLLMEWRPDHNRPVDYINVRDILVDLCHRFNVIQVSFDKFQSQQVVQELIEIGINARQMSFSANQQLDMYRALRTMVYSNIITWPGKTWDILRPQLRYLIQKGSRITHDEKRSGKDLADAVAAAAWYASGASLGRTGRMVLESVYGSTGGHIGVGATTGIVRRRLTS